MSANIVVADAGPLHYLVLIDCAEILPSLFDHVLVPFAVRDELIHPGAPKKVKGWILKACRGLKSLRSQKSSRCEGFTKAKRKRFSLPLKGRLRPSSWMI